MNNVATEFMHRADALVNTGRSNPTLQQIDFDQRAEFERQDNELVGLQWRFSETADPTGGIWFYHGVEKERIRRIIEDDDFPDCQPFSTRFLLDTSTTPKAIEESFQAGDAADPRRLQTAENLLPDGSFFGIGFGPIDGLIEANSRESNLDQLKTAILV